MRVSKGVLSTGAIVLGLSLPGMATSPASAAPQHATKTPGTLVKTMAVTTTGVDGTAYIVKYWSENFPANKPVTVTGLVIVPNGTAPAGGWPVVTWAHGTNGTNGTCSPSLDPTNDIPLVNHLLDQGWEVVATDYQGEGNAALKPTKGILPYLVGTSAARNALDIVKAVQNSSTFAASSNYVVWGHSEGGQTAMFALSIAATYAPALTLKGVLALAPPSNFATLLSNAETTNYWPLLFLAVGGYQSAYGSAVAPASEVLTKQGKQDLKWLKQFCLASVGGALLAGSFNTVFSITAGAPLPTTWQDLIDQNDPANFSSSVPVPLVIVSGVQDPLVLPSTTDSLAQGLCELTPTQPLERWLYAGLDHGGIVSNATIGDYVQWTADRFAGAANHTYTPVGSGANTPTVTSNCG